MTVTGTTWPQPACPVGHLLGRQPEAGSPVPAACVSASGSRAVVRARPGRVRGLHPPRPGPPRLRGCSRVAASHRAPCLLGYDARTTRRTGLKAQFHELRHRRPPTYSPLSKTQSTSMTQKVLSPGFPPIPRAHAKRYCHHVPASGFREVPRHVAAGVRLPVPNTAFSRCPVTRIRGTCQEWPRHSYWRAACHRAYPGLATPTPVHSDHRTCPLT